MSALSSLFLKTAYSLSGALRTARRHSYFKAGFILCFMIAFEAGLCALFVSGFMYLDKLGGISLMIIQKLFSLFFMGLSFMLVTSSALTSYAAFYRSRELQFLAVRPYTVSEIVMYKFFESCVLSSWAFFFIILPFIGSYAWHQKLTPLFAVWTFLFSVPLVLLCSGIGTIITMIIVRWIPRGFLMRIGVALFLVVVMGSMAFSVHTSRLSPEDQTGMILTRLIPGFHLASYPLLPSWWISEGIISLTRRQWLRGGMLWGMLTANGLILCLAVEAIGKSVFYEGWQRVLAATGISSRRKPLLGRLDRALAFLAHDIRAIIVKDIRAFLRDPLQWSQFLIFFGLLGLYFASLRSFRYHELPAMFRTFIAFLNIFSVSTVMCSLASRFIYPQLSLEGQGFWVLGLAPTTMGRILMTKFGLSLAGMSVMSMTLMYLSTEMLSVSRGIQVVAVALAAAISIAVSGMSAGLGAIFMDLEQRNPAAIVSGFGGTLNLVLSLGFMLATVVPFAAVFYFDLSPRQFRFGLSVASAWLIALTILTAIIPLMLGRKALLTREY